MINNYTPTPQSMWTGRVDSNTDFDAFRWHQWIQVIDLNNSKISEFNGAFGIALLGFNCDEGVKRNKGREGAAGAPNQIRKELMNLPCHFKQDLKIFDAGNINVENITLEEGQKSLEEAVSMILSLNLFPIVMGGGHEVALGNYNGIMKNFEISQPKPRVGIINFDAHFDIRPHNKGGSSGTMFSQIADYCAVEEMPFDYFCIGIQQRGNTRLLFNRAKDLGVKYLLAREISNENLVNIFTTIDRFMKNKDHIYITICSDVFASAYAPGVSSAQPLGLQPWAVLTILKHILRSEKAISFDIAEVSPRFDRDNVTANLASTVIFHTVQQLAEIKDLDFEDIF